MQTSKAIILNVNPGESALGFTDHDAAIAGMRRRFDKEGASIARKKSGSTLRLLFGDTSASKSQSMLLLWSRLSFGIALAVYGAITMTSLLSSGAFLLILGIMLIPGFATRMTLAPTAFIYAVAAGMAIETGQFPVADLLIAAGSMIIAGVGPGRYSADAILRRKIFRAIRRYETRKLMERRFSYRAYEYALNKI